MLRQFTRFFSVVLLLTFGFVGAATAQAVHGVFRVVKGDVKIIQGSDQKEVKARLGQKVYPKDTIIAAKDSRAKIVMVDNNELNISPESKIEIQSYEYKPNEDKKSVMLNVLYGKVRAKVNQKYDGDNKFNVKTPSAVAGVRGTDFFTSYNRGTNETKIVTFEGRVAFGQAGAGGTIVNPVYVSRGETTSQRGSSAPTAPISVPKAELAEMEVHTDATKAPDQPQGGRQPADVKKEGDAKKEEKKTDRNPSSVGSETQAFRPEITDTPSGDVNPPPVSLPPPPPRPIVNTLPPKNDFTREVISGARKNVIINLTTGP